MTLDSVHQLISLYLWFLISVILTIYLLLARLYESSTTRTFYHWGFLIPILAFGGALILEASRSNFANGLVKDVLWAIGGGSILILAVRLYWLMMAKRTDA
ncbi:MAG: hypothetical protein ACOYLB_00275 [Phototrophicaceae bacterium]